MNPVSELKKIRIRFEHDTSERYLLAEGKGQNGCKYRVIQLGAKDEIFPVISLIEKSPLLYYWKFLDTASIDNKETSERIWQRFHNCVIHLVVKEKQGEKTN